MNYWPLYCEENIWHLCQNDAVLGPGTERHVVFIGNPAGAVPMWHQRAGDPNELMIWDYHVVLIDRPDGGQWRIWDLDSRLGAPVSAERWCKVTIHRFEHLPVDLVPRFGWVTGDRFVELFASDRSHMSASPSKQPPWPPIGDGSTNLARFIAMEPGFVDEVLSLEAFRLRLCCAGP